MIKICAFLLLYLSIIIGHVYGQTCKLSYRFSVENSNLPSNNIYKILSDDDGNIWLGTNKGLVKYNGTDFKTFNTQKGMADDDVVNLFYQKEENHIWALTFNSKLTRVNTRTHKLINIDPKEKVAGAYMYANQNADVINFLTSGEIISLNHGKFTLRSIKGLDYKNILFIPDKKHFEFNQSLFEEVKWACVNN